MLADSLLPIPFLAEAVNTACYVQNRLLVTKPHNKTPYELLLIRTPSIGFLRPFCCHVTILNTLDPLGKFNRKDDVGFLVRYSNTNDDTIFEVKEPEFEVQKPKSAVHVSPSNSTKTKKHDAKTNKEAKGKSPDELSTRFRNLSEDFEDFSDNITNNVNAANTPILAVSPIQTTRVYKDYLVTQIIDDLSLATQIRSMTRMVKDQGGLNQINNEDFYTCMFACFLSQEEPKRVHQALKDPSWIEAMQEELLQFKMQKEEGIDYEEVFASVARIEAIRLFLAYASFMGFMVYQIDVKSAFLYGTIEEDLYVYQPSGFEDLDYPDKVYKVVKALYGLHQAPRAWYETLANYLLENDLCKAFKKLMKDKFQMSSIDGKSASTPIDNEKPLLKDPNGEDVDVHTYRLFKVTNDVVGLQALIDRKKVLITEDTVHQVLRLDDAQSIDCLPNEEIFAELERMGTTWNEFSSSMASAVICLATGMLVPEQVADDVDNVVDDDVADVVVDVINVDDVADVVVDVINVDDVADVVAHAADEPTPPSPAPTTPPPPQQEVTPTPPLSPITLPSSPPQQQPS
nr:retrovirus-related Pol polyprotein from transposon TNT 1-94 [Tanacetum cinerariifolium]